VATIAVIYSHLPCVGPPSHSPQPSGCWSPDCEGVPSTRASSSRSGGQIRSILCAGIGECSPTDTNRIQDPNTIMAEDIHIVRLLLHLIDFIALLHHGRCCFMLHDVCAHILRCMLFICVNNINFKRPFV
jgi:hypothetical protein